MSEQNDAALVTVNSDDDKALALVTTKEPIFDRSFGSIFAEIFRIGLPINLTYTIGYIIWAASILFSKMVDRLEPEEQVVFLEFIAVMPNYFTTFFFFLLSPVLGVYPRLYQFRGELDAALDEKKSQAEIDIIRDKISHTNAIALAINTVSTLICCTLYFFSEEILSAWQNEKVAAYSAAYLRPMCAAMPAIFWRVAIEVNLFAAEQQIKTGIIDIITCSIAIAVAGYISADTSISVMDAIRLIAWCFVGESWVTFLANLAYLLLHPELRKNRYWKLCGHSKEVREGTVAAIVPQSLSSMGNMSLEVLVGFIITTTTAQINSEDEAALSFSMQLFNAANILTGAISMGGGQSLGILLGKMKEAKRFLPALKTVFASILANLTQISPLAILTWAWSEWLILAFSTLNADHSNSSAQMLLTNSSTLAPAYTTALTSVNASDAEEIESRNAVFAPIMGAIIVLETIRYSLVFLARSSVAPVSALLFCIVGIAIGLGSGIGAAFALTDAMYTLLGWLAGLLLTDCFLVPLVRSLNTQDGVEQIGKREKGGPRYELSVVIPEMFRSCCASGTKRNRTGSNVTPRIATSSFLQPRTRTAGSFVVTELREATGGASDRLTPPRRGYSLSLTR